MRTRVPSASLQLFFGGAGVGVDLRGGGGGAGGRRFAADERFGFAHGQAARDDLARHAALRGFVGQREERARVAHRQRAGREVVADFDRQAQQPDVVGDRRAILADGGRDRFLRQLQFVGQPPVRLRFFDRIQIVALDVLDERDLQQLIVGDLADDDGDLEQAGALRRAPAAFAGDDLVAVADAADERSAESRRSRESTARAPRAALRRCACAAGADSGTSRSRSSSVGRCGSRSTATRWRRAAASGMSALRPRPSAGRFSAMGHSSRRTPARARRSAARARSRARNSCASAT